MLTQAPGENAGSRARRSHHKNGLVYSTLHVVTYSACRGPGGSLAASIAARIDADKNFRNGLAACFRFLLEHRGLLGDWLVAAREPSSREPDIFSQ